MTTFERERLRVIAEGSARFSARSVSRTGLLPTGEEVAVRVNDGAIHFGNTDLSSRDVEDVYVLLSAVSTIVVRHTDGRQRWRFVLESAADIDPFLEALGRRREITIFEARVTSNLAMFDLRNTIRFGMASLVLLGLIAWLSGTIPIARLIIPALFYMLGVPLFLLVQASRVVIGIDGLTVAWLSVHRHYRWRDIESIAEHDDTALVTLRSGRSFEVSPSADETASEVVHRIKTGLDASRAAAPAIDEVQFLARQQRENQVGALRELGREDYRHQGFTRDRLLRIVEDPTHDGAMRARAAVALSGSPDETIRARVRVAASAIAAPKLRIAWNDLVSEDDARIEQALEQIELDQATSASRRAR